MQKLADANAALEAFAPLISRDAFEQAQGMLSRGDALIIKKAGAVWLDPASKTIKS